MPEEYSPWAQAAANTAQSAGGAIMGLALGGIENKRQIKQQRKLNELNLQQHKAFTDFNSKKQLEMWEATNYPAQIAQMKKAGINPALLYDSGGMSGSTGLSAGNAGNSQATRGTEGIQGMGMGLQSGMMLAQIKLMEAQTEKTKVEAAKTAGVDTKNVEADTINKELQSVILKYTGLETKDVYEQVMNPARGIQAKTYQDEMEARQGVAGTIYELWVEGKLKEQSLEQIEGLALQNANTREARNKIIKEVELLEQNIKGAKIGNIIAELEAQIQKETGVDKTSPAWMKVLARLFVGLTGR